jgi:hypothetical protein
MGTGWEATPVARLVRLNWPGGGIAWYRPACVEVRVDGGMRQVPIRDTTRWAVGGAIVAPLALAALVHWAQRVYLGRRGAR